MRIVYIAHRLGAGEDRETNRREAARWVAWAAQQGVAPVATWITLAGEWSEDMLDLGLVIDCELVRRLETRDEQGHGPKRSSTHLEAT